MNIFGLPKLIKYLHINVYTYTRIIESSIVIKFVFNNAQIENI